MEEYQTFINFKSYEYTKDKILFLCNITYRTFFVGKRIDDNEPVDKQETVTLYISANMGQTSGLTGTMHDCMLVKEKGDDTWNT